MTDDSIMPFGKYTGWKMRDVPATYLLWVFENVSADNDDRKKWVLEYIRANLVHLRREAKEE